MRVLNDKIDFSKFDDNTIRQNEIWLPTIKFKPGLFTDAGYRFRQNIFKRADHWFPGTGTTIEKFYDILLFSNDEIEVGKEFMTIAEMWFRVKTDNITHTREVFSFMNWLGSIGGITGLLTTFAVFLFGGYTQFNAFVNNVETLNVPKY